MLLTFNHGLVSNTWLHSERPVLDVLLDSGIVEFTSNQTLGIKDSVDGVHGDLRAEHKRLSLETLTRALRTGDY